MSIVHNAYAGQIALKNGDYEIFDDIGCLMEYIEANGEDEIGAAFIKDAAKMNGLTFLTLSMYTTRIIGLR